MPTHKPINLRKPPTLKRGPAKHSKRVTDRLKAAYALIGRIRSLQEKAARGFGEKFGEELREGEAMPDLTLALTLVGRSVKTAIELLEEADSAYCGQGVSRRFLNEACLHTAAHETYPELVDVRQAIEQRFGKAEGRRVHEMTEPTRRKPKRQHPQLEGVVEALENRQAMPRPVRPGPPGEREQWLARLKPGYEKLTRMLEDLEEHERHEERLRDDRDFELESFDVVYSQGLAFVRSILTLAGIGDREIRSLLPTVQRRRLKGKARQERAARAQGSRVDSEESLKDSDEIG